jgi:hypothetical protein
VLDHDDNVAVALENLKAGTELASVGPVVVTVRETIRAGHKVAIRPIERSGAVIKYGEVVGIASVSIAPGAHVHVHNVASSRLPGPERNSAPS